jgi:glycosyltransferase involved in cell wall biosynthesis
MNLVVTMVVKNEEFYIDMAIRSVVDFVFGVCIIDTGSSDRTLSVISNLSTLYPKKIYWESKKFCEGEGRFPNDYDEMVSRNYAIEKVLEIFGGDYILVLDGDEVVNQRYFEVFEDVKRLGAKTFGHATNIPASPYLVWGGDEYYTIWSNKWRLFDPHVRAWSTDLNVKFTRRPTGHMIAKVVGREEDLHHEYVTEDNVHFHLHRSFGPKSLYRYLSKANFLASNPLAKLSPEFTGTEACKNLGIEYKDIFNQELFMEKFPNYFDDGKFVPTGVDEGWVGSLKPMTHPLPKFVVDKWKDWGYWI